MNSHNILSSQFISVAKILKKHPDLCFEFMAFDGDLTEFHHFFWEWNIPKSKVVENLFSTKKIKLMDSTNYNLDLFYIELEVTNKITKNIRVTKLNILDYHFNKNFLELLG